MNFDSVVSFGMFVQGKMYDLSRKLRDFDETIAIVEEERNILRDKQKEIRVRPCT